MLPQQSTTQDQETSFNNVTTASLAQAIMLMTEELRRRENHSRKVKVKEPDIFNGSDPQKLNNFILQCNLFFRNNSAYSEDGSKVTFAMSYLRDTALEYFEPSILDSDETPEWLDNWSSFVCALRTQFGPIDPIADAEDGIDNLKMHDNQHIVNYNVNFNRLAIRTGWDDSVLRHCYYSGLAERIKDIMGQQEKPSTLSAMKNLAHSIDSRYWERLREKSRSENSAPLSAIESEIPDPPHSNSTPPKFSDNLPKTLSPISDKLGKDGKLTFRERQRRFDNNLCLCCGGVGHMVKECPKSLAKLRAAQLTDDSDESDSTHYDSDHSSSGHSNSGHSDSNHSESNYPGSGHSDSEVSDAENSDSDNSSSEISDHENPDPKNSDPVNSDSENLDSENSDSNDSGSDSESD